MLIPRCPNCSLALVLLERRQKYKCSKCGKLFLEKEIDEKTFRQWNIKQRELDKHNLKIEKKRPKLTEEEKEKHRTEYILKNREKIRAKAREDWHSSDKMRDYLKEYYRKDINRSRLIKRIRYYRVRQGLLARQQLEINSQNPYIDDLRDSFSTFGLSNLLFGY